MFQPTPQDVRNSLGSGVEVIYLKDDLYSVKGVRPKAGETCRLLSCGAWLFVLKDAFFVRLPEASNSLN